MRGGITFTLLIFMLGFQSLYAKFDKMAGTKELFYIGTFSENGSLGIYVYAYHRKNQRYDLLQSIISKENPSFIDISPNGNFLFSANREGLKGKEQWGSITSFAIDGSTGKLKVLENQFSYGDSPCHISFHPSGKYVFVSHYRGGNFVVFPVDEHGRIGEPTTNIQLEGKGTIMPRQEQPHTHSVVPSHDGKFLYVSDLGLDKILIYEFNELTGKVKPASQPFIKTNPGAGPRHFTFNPEGDLAFSSEEISSSISCYKVNTETGGLQLVQRLSALPPVYHGKNSSADIHTSPDGNYVYISNRGYNGLAIFKVVKSGKMKNIGYIPTIGQRPRNFLPDPRGEFMLVANRDSNEINIFLMEKNGTLKETSGYLPVPSPVCIKYLEIN